MAEGTVIIIGGAEDKVRDRVILHRFATLAGGRDAIVAVINEPEIGLEKLLEIVPGPEDRASDQRC